MAFNNYNSYEKKKNYNDKPYNKSKPTVEKIEAEVLPGDYVDLAETNMGELINERQAPTTSKLRNILSIIMDIYNEENRRNENTLSKESITQLQFLRIRMLYEAGREKTVKAFIDKTKALQYLKGIEDDRERFLNYCHYMEALVAYHRFHGGRD